MATKKFMAALRKDLNVRRSGLFGFGRKLTVSGAGLEYTVDRRAASAATAELINSKIPVATLRPPQ